MPQPRRLPTEARVFSDLLGVSCVDELVAALLDAGEVGAGVDVVDVFVDEGGPVVGRRPG